MPAASGGSTALSPLLLGVDSGVGSSASSTASSTSPRCLPVADSDSVPVSPRESPKHQATVSDHEEEPDVQADADADADDADEEQSNEGCPGEQTSDQRCQQAADEEQKENDIERNFRFLLESLGFTCDPREVTLVSSRPHPGRPHAPHVVLHRKSAGAPGSAAPTGDPVQCDQPLKAARLGLTQSCVGAQAHPSREPPAEPPALP